MKVSVLIPCYNAERWIRKAIQSALAQTYSDIEVIVVDDGSTDRSADIVQDFGDSVRLEATKHLGGNQARNRLLQLATGTWLQYLDADDYLKPSKISDQVEFIATRPDTDIVYSPVLYEYWDEDKITHTEIPKLQVSDDPWTLLLRWKLPQTGGPLWKRRTINDVNGWNNHQPCCQETELYLRLLKHGAHFAYFDQAGAVYRQWSEQTVCKSNPLLSVSKRLEIIDAIEFHLKELNDLSDERIVAIAETRMECARSLYALDPDFARLTARRAKILRPRLRLPDTQPFPTSYRLAYQLLGFDRAECIARAIRKRKRAISSSESVT